MRPTSSTTRGCNPHTIDDELYSYSIRKLNNKLKGFVIGITNGFEVFRVVVREMDPITKGTKKGLLQNFMNKNQPRCANLEASRDRVNQLDQCITEYREKVGEEIQAELKSLVLHHAVDADIVTFMGAH